MVKKINEFKELQKKKGKKGFSMIELIIVLAIMAILVALIGTQLIPYLEKSREKRDMTTLDTCLTALQSAVSDAEVTLNKNTKYAFGTVSGTTDLNTVNSSIAQSFTTYSGLAINATPFKSKAAKNGGTPTVSQIIFDVDGNGKISAIINGVKVESSNGGSVTSN